MRTLAALAPIVVAAGCAGPTSVLLVVDGDIAPRTEMESLVMTISAGSETLWVGTHGFDVGDELPQTLRIVPGNTIEESYRLALTARRGDEDVLSVERWIGFRRGRQTTVRVCLFRGCIDSTLPGCAEGVCEGIAADGDGDADADVQGDADACEPEAELCNGLDDDCDPATPDGADDPGVGLPCDGPDGDACEEGVVVCDGGELACDDASDDAEETCNGVDDDCDGIVDEEGSCPCEQRWNGSHAYLLCTTLSSWPTARASCQDVGYDLVTIEDELENDFLTTETTALSATGRWWIGLSDLESEGIFLWAGTGLPPVWSNWAVDEPNDYGGGEDCGEIHYPTPGFWNDEDCSSTKRFVCEAW